MGGHLLFEVDWLSGLGDISIWWLTVCESVRPSDCGSYRLIEDLISLKIAKRPSNPISSFRVVLII